jgi:hypothetical protein
MPLNLRLLRKKPGRIAGAGSSLDFGELHCRRAPAPQNLVDVFAGGWTTGFPPEFGVTAGPVNFFDFDKDPRVGWADGVLKGRLRGARVLELGPFEAYNTWQLEKLGAEVTSVESNKISFLKCLLVKEITGLKASFLHGDGLAYLDACLAEGRRFDIVWASGILYHQTEPLRFLSLVARAAPKIFIHTHYYEETIVKADPAVARWFDPGKDVIRVFDGFEAVYRYRSYRGTDSGPAYAGGPDDHSFWLAKEDIFAFLNRAGFSRITIEVDHPHHPNGPGMCFLAERPD